MDQQATPLRCWAKTASTILLMEKDGTRSGTHDTCAPSLFLKKKRKEKKVLRLACNAQCRSEASLFMLSIMCLFDLVTLAVCSGDASTLKKRLRVASRAAVSLSRRNLTDLFGIKSPNEFLVRPCLDY
jgi:hypothetical protein